MVLPLKQFIVTSIKLMNQTLAKSENVSNSGFVLKAGACATFTVSTSIKSQPEERRPLEGLAPLFCFAPE